MLKRMLFALLLCVSSFFQIANAAIECDLARDFIEARDSGLHFVPGEERVYPSGYFRGARRFDEVYLVIYPETLAKLRGIASTLAQGQTEVSSQEIYNRLTSETSRANGRTVRIPLSRLLSKKIVSLTGRTASCDGPNCWNATLNWFKPETPIKFSSGREIMDLINSNFEKVLPGSEIRFGDVIAVVAHGTLEHTAVYLNDNIIWHKGSDQQRDPYTFETLEGAMSAYRNKYGSENLKLYVYRSKISGKAGPAEIRPAPPKVVPLQGEKISPKVLLERWRSLLSAGEVAALIREIESTRLTQHDRSLAQSQLAGYSIRAADFYRVGQNFLDVIYNNPPNANGMVPFPTGEWFRMSREDFFRLRSELDEATSRIF